MPLRGSITVECDRPTCHAELVISVWRLLNNSVSDVVTLDGWWRHADGKFTCPQCREEDRDGS